MIAQRRIMAPSYTVTQMRGTGPHPLQLRLAYEGTCCPYDLPGERGRSVCGPKCPLWMKSAISGGNAPSGCSDGTDKSKSKSEGPLEVATGKKNMELAVPTHDVDTCNETIVAVCAKPAAPLPVLAAVEVMPPQPSTWGIVMTKAELDVEKNSTGTQTEEVLDAGGKESSSAKHLPAQPKASQGAGVSPALSRATRDVAVGCDDAVSESAGRQENDARMRPGICAEPPMMVGRNQIEHLLSDTVELVYKKLQGAALKVVALDDLKHQLTENFDHLKEKKCVDDKIELSMHLYALRRQVENLRKEWDVYKESLEAAVGMKDQMFLDRPERTVRVEIIRGYEEEPVPYKKAPFRPLVVQEARKRSETSSFSSDSTSSASKSSTTKFSSSYITYTSQSSSQSSALSSTLSSSSLSTDHSSSLSTSRTSSSFRSSSSTLSS
ncbi:unnamed protein product [Trypanosoma congolense IL3000]|uniref:WGS project CAEQ00000000 data, annotated contig 116 n=1 Tax=Trypanosoma congolense (strain IL3000) TaxID=1068625 RepID=F9W4B8_TRYCI|nr:unnamed protein product [Trypanosoma congolense IL3000]